MMPYLIYASFFPWPIRTFATLFTVSLSLVVVKWFELACQTSWKVMPSKIYISYYTIDPVWIIYEILLNPFNIFKNLWFFWCGLAANMFVTLAYHRRTRCRATDTLASFHCVLVLRQDKYAQESETDTHLCVCLCVFENVKHDHSEYVLVGYMLPPPAPAVCCDESTKYMEDEIFP